MQILPGNLTISKLFLLLTIAHILHATEEYFGKLWQIYPPAIYVCNTVSSNPETGFIIVNSVYVLVSFAYFLSIRKNHSPRYSLIWIFLTLQTLNVIGHIIWTISERTYTPGFVTSFITLFIVISVVRRLLNIASSTEQ